MKTKVSIFIFRRDLRIADNTGLSEALKSDYPILPVFIFDKAILSELDDKKDRRVDYIHQALLHINNQLKRHRARLNTFYGTPSEIVNFLVQEYDVQAIYYNRDYEPKAIQRDLEISELLKRKQIQWKGFKDQVIFDTNEILKSDNSPYTVYSAYTNKWKEKLKESDYKSHQMDLSNFLKQEFQEILTLEAIGFGKTDLYFQKPELNASIISHYDSYRDYPALERTTQLSVALRFGTISIRECVSFALSHNFTWLNELIWREFFMQILFHFPHVVQSAFKPKYNLINWRNNEHEFELWCLGKTGYPIVDAGMRQLNQTGFMHNRVRMITASFLCKHLLIDWRWGEAYFAKKLIDYDLSANNGNWQWSAGSGCDAAPYFRIFNPDLQSEKFDKNFAYIKKWLPEFGTDLYPNPIVDHKFARNRALQAYKRVLE